jgi:Cytochrome P460
MHAILKGLAVLGSCVALIAAGAIALADSPAKLAQDKYALKAPGGLAFSEFRGYESWQVISVSHNPKAVAVILGNPTMIKAYEAGIPANGKPVPDGAKMAKVHWKPKQSELFPAATVAGAQHDVDFMVKDSTRFADGGGWGYAVFTYDPKTDTFAPPDTDGQPAQETSAKCGLSCHTIAKARDYVFTEYGHR